MRRMNPLLLTTLSLLLLLITPDKKANAGWQKQYPTFTSSDTFHGVWGSSGNNVFAVGASGRILNYDGTVWNQMTPVTGNTLEDVWGTSGSDVFAVGGSGTILHCDGTSWIAMAGGTTNGLSGVWGSSGLDVFVVGDSGTILHYDGTSWISMTSGITDDLYCVWGTSGSDVFTVGDSGLILHYDGTSWSPMTSGTTYSLRGVWGNSGIDVFVVGSSGTILHYNGSSWIPMASGSTGLYDVWGSSGSDVFAVGSSGTILHYDGNSWSSMNSGTTNVYRSIWGSSSSDMFAIGDRGTIFHYDGSQWSSMACITAQFLRNVWGSSGSDVFATASSSPGIFHYDGTNWSPMTSPNSSLNGVWGSSESDVFAVDGSTILHYDGTTWETITGGNYLKDGWGNSGSDVFAVGGYGTILHYNGTSWEPMNSGTDDDFTGVWGSSGSDVFAVGESGMIFHYDGTTWSPMASGTTQYLRDVWGNSGSDVFVTGNYGLILHYDGISWSSMISGTTYGLYGIWGSSGSDVFAVGSSGTILHYDGTSWKPMNSGATDTRIDVWGSSGSDVFVIGYYNYSTMIHYDGTPTSTTNAATYVTDTSVTLNASINPEGKSTTVEFEYGAFITNENTITAAESPLNAGTTSSFASVPITDLLPGTIYHFRVKATNSAGTSYGYFETFTTAGTTAKKPAVSTSSATSIVHTSAVLNGIVNPSGASTSYWFHYGPTTSYGSTTAITSAGTGASDVTVETTLAGLIPGTTYHYRVAAQNAVGTSYGGDRYFATSRPSKAVIVAGGGPYAGNNLWNATEMNTNFAFRSLILQGYTKDTIYYLSPNTSCDVDGDGKVDVDANATCANLDYTITDWSQDAANLFIYMTGHGGNGNFRIGEFELLSATDFDSWLDIIQNSILGDVVVLIDSCKSGSFVPLLTPPSGKSRFLATSSASDQEALFASSGTLSFSYLFWAHIFNGDNFYNSYVYAKNGITLAYPDRQSPQIEGNGNGTANEKEDTTLAALIKVGNEDASAGDLPSIGSVSDPQTLTTGTSAGIWAKDVIDADGISRVWAVITPPGYTGSPDDPVIDLPTLDLSPNSGHYQGTYDSFSTPGTYNIAIFAEDTEGYRSLPAQTTVAAPADAPTATTGDANPVASTSATLNGTVNPNGESTTVTFEYSTTTNYGSTATATQSPLSGTTAQSVSVGLTGLTPGVTYHFRVTATNSAGTRDGTDQTFTTSAIIPTVTTTAATNITTTSATGNGNITALGSPNPTQHGICWGTSLNPTVALSTKTEQGEKSTTGAFTSSITGLSAGTTYHVRAYATNSAGTAYGNDVTFTTSSITPPTVTTSAVSSITASTATSGGDVTSEGSASVTAKGICWSTSSNPTISDSKTPNGTGIGSFTSAISGLSASTTYYVRAYATNSEGTVYGNEVSFTTAVPTTTPTVATTAISSIDDTSATSGGDVTSDGGDTVTAKGICWSTSTPTITDNKTTDGDGTGSFTSSITGLSSGTTYHVRAYATNSAGTAYGNDVSFTTSYSSARYVNKDGSCGGELLCHTTIQEAINAASTGEAIMISGEIYDEDITLDADKSLTLIGSSTGTTTLRKAPKAPRGSLTLQKMIILPQ